MRGHARVNYHSSYGFNGPKIDIFSTNADRKAMKLRIPIEQ